MDENQYKERILSVIPEAVFSNTKQFLIITIKPDELLKLLSFLKDENGFDYLICETGVDYSDHMEVIYHIESTSKREQLMVKVIIPDRQNAEIESVYSIWKSSEYHEREIFDLLGIRFKNHPDLRRIFLDDNWAGHPLRKDYVDTVNIVER
jgi:NADH/F420H2 dehydrogenase subunit C